MYLAEQFTHQAHQKTIIVATKVCKSKMYQIIPCTCIHVQKYSHSTSVDQISECVYELVKCVLNGSSCIWYNFYLMHSKIATCMNVTILGSQNSEVYCMHVLTPLRLVGAPV